MKKLYAILILSLISFANALYLTLQAFAYKAGDTSNFLCDINDTFSCSNLFAFDFSWIFGVPFPAIALVVYPIIALVTVLGILKKCQKSFHITAALGVGGMMFNSYIILNEFQVGVFCPACLACSVAITAIAILSFIGIRNQKTTSK